MRRKIAWWTALPVALAWPGVSAAQDVAPTEPVPVTAEPSIEFSAESVTYDSDADFVSATGAVRMARDGNYLAADRVTWSRVTGQVRAEGNVVVVNPQGDKLIGENVVLTDTLRDGTIENLLVVLEKSVVEGDHISGRYSRLPQVDEVERAELDVELQGGHMAVTATVVIRVVRVRARDGTRNEKGSGHQGRTDRHDTPSVLHAVLLADGAPVAAHLTGFRSWKAPRGIAAQSMIAAPAPRTAARRSQLGCGP